MYNGTKGQHLATCKNAGLSSCLKKVGRLYSYIVLLDKTGIAAAIRIIPIKAGAA